MLQNLNPKGMTPEMCEVDTGVGCKTSISVTETHQQLFYFSSTASLVCAEMVVCDSYRLVELLYFVHLKKRKKCRPLH